MKSKMKRIIFLMTLLLSTTVAIGQEFIKQISIYNERYSIVREVSTGRWLVCDITSEENIFTLVNDTGTSMPQIHVGANSL